MLIDDIASKLVSVTRSGSVSDWIDRMGVLAHQAGVHTELINWTAAPHVVSYGVVRQAISEGRLEALQKLLG